MSEGNLIDSGKQTFTDYFKDTPYIINIKGIVGEISNDTPRRVISKLEGWKVRCCWGLGREGYMLLGVGEGRLDVAGGLGKKG